ncbi:DUF5926 family protein [Ornithinicoccus hortensis]|uniref:DUF5926 domain-containing protein n=1 Tax=Ornithinicoccus hortensis TaxID=82346 RepID=A0A542YNA3_9MICO|nr:DUF5926 family protein [Ornithinicoccus hortensis]TQL49541.1 hypothetical protein FB467_0616 [Ornithinicoccus hortensis]
MGKASRRKRRDQGATSKAASSRAPFVARPFEGLPQETEWVAMREIIPAATAPLQVRLPDAEPREITLASVLPGALPALHRQDGTVLVALQSRTSSGDASRDIVAAIQTAVAAEPGTTIRAVGPATAQTPRLEDVLVEGQQLDVEVHEDFTFWLEDPDNVTPEVQASLEQTNAAAVPTEKLEGQPSAYWCKMGERAYIRWILAEDEDAATTALARLQAAGQHTLGEGTTLLGAFRAAGLLVPVLEVDPAVPSADHVGALADLADRYAGALAKTEPLTPEERRARDGLVSRQVTLR